MLTVDWLRWMSWLSLTVLVGLAGWKVEMDRRYVPRGQHSPGKLHFHADNHNIQEMRMALHGPPVQNNVIFNVGTNAHRYITDRNAQGELVDGNFEGGNMMWNMQCSLFLWFCLCYHLPFLNTLYTFLVCVVQIFLLTESAFSLECFRVPLRASGSNKSRSLSSFSILRSTEVHK